MGPGVCEVRGIYIPILPRVPTAWSYPRIPRVAGAAGGGRGASGCRVMPLGPLHRFAPRPSPSRHLAGGASEDEAQAEPPFKRAAPQLLPVEFNAVGQTCGVPDWRVMVKNDRSVTGLTPVTSD
uniref:Uncharacterized protein n=1 Tax=Oryza sativa subsp. japonica TaxID=39947 RepID=Q7EYT1_ORYSJ|nr:hypothetical protein [Oryza sativa Japonica Group]